MIVKLPQILDFVDYHEIEYTRDILRDFIPGVKCKQLGLIAKYPGSGFYAGLFYLNKLPPKTGYGGRTHIVRDVCRNGGLNAQRI